MAVSPGDQLLHPEKKKTKAERDAEGDQVDSAHADREYMKLVVFMFGILALCFDTHLMSNSVISSEKISG